MKRLETAVVAAALSAAVVLAVLAQDAAPPQAAESLDLALPPNIYAVAGIPIGIHYANVVRPVGLEGLQFDVACPLGKDEGKRWMVAAGDADAGEHPLVLAVKDANGRVLAEARATLRVAPRKAGEGRSVRILIIGDSLTGTGGGYPAVMARLLSDAGNPNWAMVGTKQHHKLKAVRTEGYPGWAWSTFLHRYEPNPEPEKKKVSSPFVFAGQAGEPEFDVGRYIRESCDRRPPDVVTFLLGINDTAGIYTAANDREALDKGIDRMMANAEALLAGFRKAAPEAALAVGVIPPANYREQAFEANYKGSMTAAGWKPLQHRVARRMIEQFKDREKNNVFLVPTHLFLDTDAGFPENNAVHPNPTGHEQIGASFFSWLKWRLSAQP